MDNWLKSILMPRSTASSEIGQNNPPGLAPTATVFQENGQLLSKDITIMRIHNIMYICIHTYIRTV